MSACLPYTTYNPVRRLSFFVHHASAGKDNHYMYTQAYKRHMNTQLVTCELRFLLCPAFLSICGCGSVMEISCNHSYENEGVLHRPVTYVKDGLWSGDIRLRRPHNIPLCTEWLHTNTRHSLKSEQQQSCLCLFLRNLYSHFAVRR